MCDSLHHVALPGSVPMNYLRVTNSVSSNPAAGYVTVRNVKSCFQWLLSLSNPCLALPRQSLEPLPKMITAVQVGRGHKIGWGWGREGSFVLAIGNAALFMNHLIKPIRFSK